MLEAVFVLFLCTVQGEECQVVVVSPDKAICEQQKANIIKQRGEVPKHLELICQAYERADD